MKFFKLIAALALLAVALSGCSIAPRGSEGKTPTPTPTAEKQTTVTTVTKYVCPNGNVVADETDCNKLTPTQVSTAAPATAPSSGSATTVADSGSWTPAQKCDWLRANFPQTTTDVQALGAKLAGVEPQRIRTNKYRCSTTTTESVFDGLIVLGPNEGYQGAVTMTVPAHGAIDAYSTDCGAKYTGSVSLIAGGNPNKCDDTYRASSGQVTALSMTYYPWNDADPPTSVSQSNSTSSSTTTADTTTTMASAPVCETGAQLAKDHGWVLLDKQPDSVTKYGGAQVEVKSNDTLPDGWAAQTNGPELKGGDLMTPGFYSVYPPSGACRQQLGVQG